jgi:hypothetical protein
MASTLKTTLVAGAVALAATLGTVATAQAGGHHIPLIALGGYGPDVLHDDDDDDAYGYGYGCNCGYETEDAVSAAAGVASSALGIDVEDAIDDLDD